MPAEVDGIRASDVHATIRRLIDGLVNIQDQTGEFLMTLADGRVIDTKGWHDWEWTHGIGLNGLWAYHELTGEAKYLQLMEDWFAGRFAAGGTTKNINTMSVFLAMAHVYEKTRKPVYRPWLEAWAEWAMYELPRTAHGGMQHITYLDANEQQLWDDTLMMTVVPLAKIGQLLGRPHYVDEAKRQFLLHLQYLFDPPTGLFFHGWTFADGGHHFARARWARGNAWLTMVIPEFLDLLDLPATDPLAAHLVATLRAQCAGLAPLQTDAGLWRTVLDRPEAEGSYPEASATAGFAYGLLKGRRKRYLGPEHDAVARRAVRAVLANVDERGELRNTSFGTAMGHDLQHYYDIPITSMPYGQAMAIMALVEYLHVFI